MEWHLHIDCGDWNSSYSELEDIDPSLPAIINGLAEYCIENGKTKMSDLISMIIHENPLGLAPSEKNDYEHIIDRFLLDAYMKAGAAEGTDCLWETIRKPGKTRCCSPYSDNMYRHLSDTTEMSVIASDDNAEIILYFK